MLSKGPVKKESSNSHNHQQRQLLAGCIAGNKQASEQFVRQFSDLVYRSIQHILHIKHIPYHSYDLEDLHNTIFLKLFENRCKRLRQYEGRNRCSIATWIRMIAVTAVLNHLKKKGYDQIASQKQRISIDDLPELKTEGTEADIRLEKIEQERMLDESIQRLPPRDRLFLKLHIDKELSAREVAETMQLTLENVYTIKHRLINKLKLHLES